MQQSEGEAMSESENARHAHRHAYHALADFSALRRKRDDEELWHSLSHHLRHVVYRTGLRVRASERRYVRRRTR
jgi:hypothetical protein